MKYTAFTHQGPNPKYDHNEDSIVVNNIIFSNGNYTKNKNLFFTKKGVFCVCDGVGGHIGGEVASNALVNAFKNFTKKNQINSNKIAMQLAVNLKKAVEEVQMMNNCDEMMSTFVGLFINKKQLIFMNVGDSPSFIFRNNNLTMMSKLDTYKNKLLEQGVDIKIIDNMDTAHAITSAFGMKDMSVYSTHIIEDKPLKGDKYLLMSDGVYDYIKDDELSSLLNEYKNINKLASKIEQIVLERGAKDNYSLIIIEY